MQELVELRSETMSLSIMAVGKRQLRLLYCVTVIGTIITLALLTQKIFDVGRLDNCLAKRSQFGPLPSGLGYMLAFTYTDQITAATTNLLSLMCLATQFDSVRVVEPFVYSGSFLGLNVSSNWREGLRFRDLYNITPLEQPAFSHYFNQLVPFESFIENAPRKVLLVHYCTGLPLCRPCGHELTMKKAKKFCELYCFELVGSVCIKYDESKQLTLEAFKKQLYSSYKESDVVILFDLYGGIQRGPYSYESGYRLSVHNPNCSRKAMTEINFSNLYPSESVLSDAAKYIKENFNGTKSYISVMLRLEWILRIRSDMSPSEIAVQCMENILTILNEKKQQSGLRSVFLTLDVGIYGSETMHSKYDVNKDLQEKVQNFISAVYGRATTLAEYEKTFSIFSVKTPGYIAMVQKTVAAMGEILILVGSKSGSTFQTSSKNLYHKYHPKHLIMNMNAMCKLS